MVSPLSFAASRFKVSEQVFFGSAIAEARDVTGRVAVDALMVASGIRVKSKFRRTSA